MPEGLGGAGGSEPGACDYTQDMNTGAVNGFACNMPPNDAMLCDACDPMQASGPYCTRGTTCYPTNAAMTTGQCAHYCCTDADCGSGTCQYASRPCLPWMGPPAGPSSRPAPMLGICIAGTSSPDGGPDAAGDAGMGGARPDDAGTDDAGRATGGRSAPSRATRPRCPLRWGAV